MMPEDQRDAVHAAVRRVIASGALGTGARRGRLLDYLVEARLEGRGGDVKAYAIGIDVLDRPDDFDPGSDSIVRVEVARLRDALTLYFATEGADAPVAIAIPKGTYLPEITIRRAEGAAETPAPAPGARARGGPRRLTAAFVALAVIAGLPGLAGLTRTSGEMPADQLLFAGVRILIEPISHRGSNPSAERLAIGMQAELLNDLSAFPWIATISYPFQGEGAPSPDLTGAEMAQDYLLSGEVFWDDARIHASFKLLDLKSYELVWSKAFETRAVAQSLEDAETELTNDVVDHIARVHGVAPHLALSKNALISSESLDAYLCFMGLYAYWSEPSEALHRELRDCMEKGVADHPQAGQGWAALAFIYMDESRQGRNPRPGRDPWEDAERAAELGLRYAPLNALSLNAAMTVAISKPEPDHAAFEAHARTLLAIYPRNAFSLANVGSKLAIKAGLWEPGLELTERALALNPRPPDWYRYAPAYHALLTGDIAGLKTVMSHLGSKSQKAAAVLRLALAGMEQDIPSIRNRIADLARLGFSDPDEIIAYIRDFRFEPALAEALVSRVTQAFDLAA